MRRRDFIVGLLFAATLRRAHAQRSTKVYRMAMEYTSIPAVESGSDRAMARLYGAFFDELGRLGYVEGQNLVVERFSAEGHPERYHELVIDVVGRNPDLIYAVSGETMLEFKAATTTIPIVGITVDPVAYGLVSNLARPGGNITGSSSDAGYEIVGKMLDLLREAFPRLSRIRVLLAPIHNDDKNRVAEVFKPRTPAGITFTVSTVDSPADEAYRRAFAAMAQEGADGLFVLPEPQHYGQKQLIVELAKNGRLPAIYPHRGYVEAGGLMSYAVDYLDLVLHNAVVVAEILKGAKTGDIPFYQARKFELVINLKTAKALGLEIPASLLARADEVIE